MITGESDFYDRNAQLIRDSFLKNPEFRSKEKLPFISFVGTSFLFGEKLENDAKNHMKSDVLLFRSMLVSILALALFIIHMLTHKSRVQN